jgi:hypothetical protein
MMSESGDTLKPLTSLQVLDAAIWCEIGPEEPQPPEAFHEVLARLLARWMLTRTEAPEMEAITTLCKTRAYVPHPERLMDE